MRSIKENVMIRWWYVC